jgi:AcrR family transcriptional regulator
MSAARLDRRIERTRNALVESFNRLFFERGYDHFTVGDIVERANVGRSTFYEHFRSKDEILAETIKYPFSPLAAAVDEGAERAQMLIALDHFWANRASARGTIRREASRRALTKVLASMIEQRLHARFRKAGPARALRFRLTAIALAEAQLGVISAWLIGEVAGKAQDLADLLHTMAQATVSSIAGIRTE